MKQVFDTSEVAHIWASQQQTSGRNSAGNFYFENQTIYSYGRHFPIATIKNKNVFFTLQRYSNTTAKHISRARSAVSHLSFILCNEVPVDFRYLTQTHETNLKYWTRQIKTTFDELGNKKIRNTQDRVNTIQYNIGQLKAYCTYFKLPIKDKELKEFLKIAQDENFVNIAREAKDKEVATNARKMKQAVKAFEQYIGLWREYKDEAIKELPAKVKDLCNFYNNNQQAFTRLRYNTAEKRLETSKGVQIPAEVAKRAYIQLNGCMEGTCKEIAVPVLTYTITETTKDYIKAGCHTIPKEDVRYIAELLNW